MAVQSIQYQLHLQATRQLGRQFDGLYSLLYKKEIIDLACKHLGFKNERLVSKCVELLKSGKYKPMPVRLVRLPKPNGGERTIGVFSELDKLVQTMVRLVLEPIFEPSFLPCSKGYRPLMANKLLVPQILQSLSAGHTNVFQADIAQFFDCLNHDLLKEKLAFQIFDKRFMALISLFLAQPFEDGRKVSVTSVGVLQGSVLAPLLANIYLSNFDKELSESLNPTETNYIRFADDLIFLGRKSDRKLEKLITLKLNKVGLSLQAAKTEKLQATKREFSYLGFRFSPNHGNGVFFGKGKLLGWQISPSEKSIGKLLASTAEVCQSVGFQSSKKHAFGQLKRKFTAWQRSFLVSGCPNNMQVYEDLQQKVNDLLLGVFSEKELGELVGRLTPSSST
jgi:RNA-directed DNA polymerase